MKRRFRRLAAAVLLVCLLPACLLGSEALLPRIYGGTYYAELGRMLRRMDEAEGARLIVIGASSVAFGLDGEQLEQSLRAQGFSFTVCPLGLYAAVGVSAMMDLVRGHLRPGDVVVLAPEPDPDMLSDYFGASAFWKCAESMPELLLRVPGEKRSALLGGYIPFLQERWAILRSGVLPDPVLPYALSAFNGRCDMSYPREGNAMPLGYDPAARIDLSAVVPSAAFVRQVSELCREAEQKGARVFLSFAPMNRAALLSEDAAVLDAYFARMNATLPCPVISDPARYVMDSGWFYDTNVHLNTAGAAIRTQQLCLDLLAAFGCYRAPSFDAPAMPASIYRLPEAVGSDDDFCFEPVPGASGKPAGFLVSGVAPDAAGKGELAVPAIHEGLPVTGLAPGALDGAEALVQLTLPETIVHLPGHAFSGAPALERLVLLHTDTLCAIEEDTFTGAERLTIFVPERAYPLYRDGQGCGDNRWTPLLTRIVSIP